MKTGTHHTDLNKSLILKRACHSEERPMTLTPSSFSAVLCAFESQVRKARTLLRLCRCAHILTRFHHWAWTICFKNGWFKFTKLLTAQVKYIIYIWQDWFRFFPYAFRIGAWLSYPWAVLGGYYYLAYIHRLQGKMLLLPNPHLVNFAGISYLQEQPKLRRIRDVCTLKAGVLTCNSLLHMFLYIWSACWLTLKHMKAFWTKLRLPTVLFALRRFN